MPSVRGVGGSLLYFLRTGAEQAVWDAEFLPEGPATSDAGLVSIDHIAQTLPFEEMSSWVLYYISLLEVAKKPLVEVADPLGLIQSQALESPDSRVRITPNASPGSRTLSARFLKGYHGAGLQQIELFGVDSGGAQRLTQPISRAVAGPTRSS